MKIVADYTAQSFMVDADKTINSIAGMSGIGNYRYPKPIAKTCSVGKYKIYKFVERDCYTLYDLYYFHYITRGKFLEDIKAYPHIVKILEDKPNFGKSKIINWDGCHQSVSWYLTVKNLSLFGERIDYLQKPVSNSAGFRELRNAGIKLSTVYKPFIGFLNNLNNFKYAGKEVNFLRDKLKPWWNGDTLYLFLEVSEDIVDKLNIERWLEFRKFKYDTVRDLFRPLFAIYLSTYNQWFESGTYVNIEGTDVYVDHHTIFETLDLYEFHLDHPTYPNEIPFGIHPKDYFKDYITALATAQFNKYKHVKYPNDFKGVLNLEGSPHRQLLTGVDLVQEGRRMHHCVGGENYLDHLVDGDMIFFHLEVPDLKHGATLSMVPHQREKPGTFWFNGSGWELDQYYGFDDESLRNHSEAQRVLDEFRNTYFEKIPFPEVISLPRSMGKSVEVEFNELPRGLDTTTPNEFVIDSFSQAVEQDFTRQPPAYQNTIGRQDPLSFSISEQTISSPVRDMINRWMGERPKKDYGLDQIVGGVPVGMMSGHLSGKSSFYQEANRAAIIKALETEMKMKMKMKIDPIFVTVESTKVDGVTRHHVKKGLTGVKSAFHPNVNQMPLLSYEFSDHERGRNVPMASWLEIRRSARHYGERDGFTFASKTAMLGNIKLWINDAPIQFSHMFTSELIRSKGEPITVDIGYDIEELKHVHFKVTIIVEAECAKFVDVVRVKHGDQLCVNLDTPFRLILDPIYSTIRKQLAHCVALVGKGNIVEHQ